MPKTLRSPAHARLLALLRETPEGAGVTQAELARRLGRLQSLVSKVEGGERRLDPVEFAAVFLALGADPAEAMRAILRRTLAELTVPYRLLLGNHDRRHPFRNAFPDQPVDEGGFVQSALDVAEGRLIFLDTLEEGRSDGHLCTERLAWLGAHLEDARGRAVYLFLHHPLDTLGKPHFGGMTLAQAEGVLEKLRAHGGVRHVFAGHVHVAASGSWAGIPFSTSRGTCHHILPDLERRDASFVAGAPGFDVALLSPSSVVVHRFDAGDPLPVLAVSPGLPVLEAAQ